MANKHTKSRENNIVPLHGGFNGRSQYTQQRTPASQLKEIVRDAGTLTIDALRDGLHDVADFFGGYSVQSRGSRGGTSLKRVAAALTAGVVLTAGGYVLKEGAQAIAPDPISQAEEFIYELNLDSANSNVFSVKSRALAGSFGEYLNPEALKRIEYFGKGGKFTDKELAELDELAYGIDALVAAGQIVESGELTKNPELEGEFTEQVRKAVNSGLVDEKVADLPLKEKSDFFAKAIESFHSVRQDFRATTPKSVGGRGLGD